MALKKFNPFSGRYFFHLHTEATDGKCSIADYFRCAQEGGGDRLIFLEHIRRSPRYNVENFVHEIRERSRQTGITAYAGFEAKLLPDGTLDISDEHVKLADVIGVAEHGWPGEFSDLQESFYAVLDRCRQYTAAKAVVWVHPGLWLKKQQQLTAEWEAYRAMLHAAEASGLFLERNRKYSLLPDELAAEFAPETIVVGADAHRLDDLR